MEDKSLQKDAPPDDSDPGTTSPSPNPPRNEYVEVSVTWTCAPEYDALQPGDYTFTAALAANSGYSFNGPFPTVMVTVGAKPAAVARIGETGYSTFAAAVAAVQDGETITLLSNCPSDLTSAWAIDKNVTIEGLYTVVFEDYSFGISGKGTNGAGKLTVNGSHIVINNAAHTAYSDKADNAAIMLDNGGQLCLDQGATLVIDAAAGDGIATWTTAGSTAHETVEILNGSLVEIRNCGGSGFVDYGAASGLDCITVSENSRIYCHDSYAGFTNTMNIVCRSSSVIDVLNNRGNGSNGPHFDISNSTVNFSGNGSHGLSAGNLTIKNSTVTAADNKYIGIAVGGEMSISEGSAVTVTGNADGSYGYAAMRLYNDYAFTVDGTSKLYIKDNFNTGLYVRKGNLTVADGAVLEITGNQVTNSQLNGYGGGLYVGYGNNFGPTVVVPADAKIYNNHATKGGDDIYVSEGSETAIPLLTFGEVGSGWALDGDPDCTDAIDGWYDDSEGARWEAHSKPLHAVEFDRFESSGMVTWQGALALKAAHAQGRPWPDPAGAGHPWRHELGDLQVQDGHASE